MPATTMHPVEDPTLFRFLSAPDLAAAPAPAVDAASGIIRSVSLITADREAAGHGVWIDQRTVETFAALLEGRRLKAYATHGSWSKDGTLDEVGYWDAAAIDGARLRANFNALDAWRKHETAEFDTLFELAAKLPGEFGASLAFRAALVWVRKDGTELATERKFRASGMWDYEEYFDPPAPADALRAMPSVRATEVYSADFVCQPAANDGLFSARRLTRTGSAMSKSILDAISPAAAFAEKLFQSAGLDFAAMFAKGDATALKAHLDQLAAPAVAEAVTAATTKLSADLTARTGELTTLRAEHEQLGATHRLLVSSLAAAGIKLAAADAKAGLSAADIQKAVTDRVSLKAAELTAQLGTPAVETTPAASAHRAPKRMGYSEFSALTPAQKMAFAVAGGRLD